MVLNTFKKSFWVKSSVWNVNVFGFFADWIFLVFCIHFFFSHSHKFYFYFFSNTSIYPQHLYLLSALFKFSPFNFVWFLFQFLISSPALYLSSQLCRYDSLEAFSCTLPSPSPTPPPQPPSLVLFSFCHIQLACTFRAHSSAVPFVLVKVSLSPQSPDYSLHFSSSWHPDTRNLIHLNTNAVIWGNYNAEFQARKIYDDAQQFCMQPIELQIVSL